MPRLPCRTPLQARWMPRCNVSNAERTESLRKSTGCNEMQAPGLPLATWSLHCTRYTTLSTPLRDFRLVSAARLPFPAILTFQRLPMFILPRATLLSTSHHKGRRHSNKSCHLHLSWTKSGVCSLHSAPSASTGAAQRRLRSPLDDTSSLQFAVPSTLPSTRLLTHLEARSQTTLDLWKL